MATLTPEIRLARASDCVDIAEMSRRNIEQGLNWRWKPSKILRLIRNPEASVIVLGDSALEGFAAMEFHPVYAHLNLLAVAPEKRRKGCGKALLTWLEESARVAGLNYISLEVRRDNPGAISFYESRGYRLEKIKSGYYGGTVDACAMAHQLISTEVASRRPR